MTLITWNIIWILTCCSFVSNQYRGQICTIKHSNQKGTCKIVDDCAAVISAIRRRGPFTRCSFEGHNEIVCCPLEKTRRVPTVAPIKITNKSPIHQQKCKQYSEAVYDYVYSSALAVNSQRMKIKVDKCGHKVVPLIVGGTVAKPKEFPHMALIGFDAGRNQISWVCGGTLISEQFVLTAGHCLYLRQYGNAKYIRLGELDLLSEDDDATPQTFNIAQIIAHPEYRTSSKYNDISLLKMAKKVKLTSYVHPACLPTTFNGPEKQAIATGWGHTEWNQPNAMAQGSNTLLKVTLEKFTQNECNSTYASGISRRLKDGIRERTQICAGSRTHRRDTCQGDSGGPLQVFHPNLYCMYTIIGVTSFGIACGNINIPGVYTRVYPYISWIESVVWKNQ